MVKRILLQFRCEDEKFFFKMKEDKTRRERQRKEAMSWEEYIKLLFGFSQ